MFALTDPGRAERHRGLAPVLYRRRQGVLPLSPGQSSLQPARTPDAHQLHRLQQVQRRRLQEPVPDQAARTGQALHLAGNNY